MKLRNLRLFFVLATALFSIQKEEVQGQCPTAAFSLPASLCKNDSLTLTNSSSGSGLTYNWDFCPGHFSSGGQEILDSTFSLVSPEGLDVQIDGNDHVVFITSKGDQSVYRFTFANGFNSSPTLVENLSDISPYLNQPSGIRLIKQNGNWYALIICYGSNNLVRVDLGTTLTGPVISTAIIADNTASGFNGPRGIDIARDSTGNIHAVVSNMLSSSLSIIDFGNDITSTPVISAPQTLTNGIFPLGIKLAKDCGTWYGFIPTYSSNNVLRVNMGSDFSFSNPNPVSICNMLNASGFDLINDSSQWKFVASNYGSNILVGTVGTAMSHDTAGIDRTENYSGSIPRTLKLIRENGSIYCFVVYEASSNFKIIRYRNNCGATTTESTDVNPTGVKFSTGGQHSVSLLVTDSYGNQNSVTQSTYMNPLPIANFASENYCEGDTTNFIDQSTIGSPGTWLWDFGDGFQSTDQNPSHYYSTPGTYTASLLVSDGNCSDFSAKVINISAKPHANFSVSSECSNTLIPFTDASVTTGGIVVSWNWDFGDGNTSILQNPDHVYSTGGTYLVALNISNNAGCVSDTTQLLNILSKPIADFSTGNTCVGSQVTFQNLTQSNGSSISGYSWDFGDGFTDTASNTSHSYPASIANYDVTLIALSPNGCTDTITQNIRITTPPVSHFNTSTVFCEGNQISFTDSSYSANDTISAWQWDFGDGNTDTIQNPNHIYTAPGSYTVSLVAVSPSYCPGSPEQISINVLAGPSANFSYSGTCLGGTTTFNNLSTLASGTSLSVLNYEFTPTDSSSFATSYFTFPSAGSFPVTLTITDNNGCVSTQTTNILINQPPVAEFSSALSCSGQLTQFTNQSSADSASVITQYTWNFGDFSSGSANTSTSTNPTHNYANAQSYLVSLIATTSAGCSDTTFHSVTTHTSAPVQFTYSPTCFGSLMEFFNPGSTYDSLYYWNFGDNQYNQLKEPVHYYASPGNYTVTLRVTTGDGCISTASKIVTVSPIPVAGFQTGNICLNAGTTLQNTSTVSTGSIVSNSWYIQEDDTLLTGINPDYTFSDTGVYHVTLTVVSDIGCTKIYSNAITVHPLPQANFSFDPQFGNPPLDVQTTDYSTGGYTYEWNFGTDTTISTFHEPSYQYTDTGLFAITQIVSSIFGCKDTAVKNIYVIRPLLDIAITGDSSYISGDHFYIVARLSNLGTRDINEVTMEARLENGSTISEHVNTFIPSGSEGLLTYNFIASFLINPGDNPTYYCIRAKNPNGETDINPLNNEKCFNRTGKLIIQGPFPNPVEKQLNLELFLPKDGNISITVSSSDGKTMQTLYSGKASKGLLEVNKDITEFSDGIYLLRINYNEEDQVIRFAKVSHSGE